MVILYKVRNLEYIILCIMYIYVYIILWIIYNNERIEWQRYIGKECDEERYGISNEKFVWKLRGAVVVIMTNFL